MKPAASSPPVHLYFFRGLSTYGHDNAKWSVFDFGPMYKNFARAFPDRRIVFHPVTGMGSGTFPEVVERAARFLRQDPVWNSDTPVHFMGHSAGGLVARQIAALAPPGKILSLLTLATPNRGSEFARWCLDMPRTHRGSTFLLRAFGYDIRKKNRFLKELTPENVARIFADQLPDRGIRIASIVCGSPRREWCWPLRLLYTVKVFKDFPHESDGVVETRSQPYGQVIARLRIDHFRQVGLFGKRHMFEEMCDVAAAFFKDSIAPGQSRT